MEALFLVSLSSLSHIYRERNRGGVARREYWRVERAVFSHLNTNHTLSGKGELRFLSFFFFFSWNRRNIFICSPLFDDVVLGFRSQKRRQTEAAVTGLLIRRRRQWVRIWWLRAHMEIWTSRFLSSCSVNPYLRRRYAACFFFLFPWFSFYLGSELNKNLGFVWRRVYVHIEIYDTIGMFYSCSSAEWLNP